MLSSCVRSSIGKRRDAECRQSAFTLIEILVVVAIIGLLVAILLPSLAAARARARTVVCASDTKQFGNAMNLFATESRGRIPRGLSRHGTPDDTSPINWVRMIARMFGNRNDYSDNFNRVPVERYPIFSCPERSREYGGAFLDYVINSIDIRGPITLAPCTANPTGGQWYEVEGVTKISDWKFPAETIYIMDAVEEDWNVEESGNSWKTLKGIRENIATVRNPTPPGNTGYDYFDVPGGKSMPTYRDFVGTSGRTERLPRGALRMHMNEGSNAVFVDGHAELVRPPAHSKGANAVYRYYLKLFGVDRDVIPDITVYTATAAIHPCTAGDTSWRPGQ